MAILLKLACFLAVTCSFAQMHSGGDLQACGDAYYHPANYTCYDGNFLCPVLEGRPTLRCGPDCFSPEAYSCKDGQLVYPPVQGDEEVMTCSRPPTTQWLSDPPYDNYFYSDCHSASQVVVTSPLERSNLSIIGPRLLVAWPAGNSGIVVFFEPASGINGTLGIGLLNGTNDAFPLRGHFQPPGLNSLSDNPVTGISTLLSLNASATVSTVILGSIRNIRDFTEGPSLLYPVIQDAIEYTQGDDGTVVLSRVWLDNITTTSISFAPSDDNASIAINNRTLQLSAGSYNFSASFDYPQLQQLDGSEVLNDRSARLLEEDPDSITSLTFLSYSQKLLAGAWRFLTYFGRDSMIAALLLQPILSEGEGGAIEAVIGAVLERLNKTTGVVCHEETIGDYSTFLNIQKNITSTAPGCTYQMVDTDYLLAPLMEQYFLGSESGRSRSAAFLSSVSTLDFGNEGLTYEQLALINAESIMTKTRPFAQEGGQTQENLIRLEENELVGEWRDSTYGIGGGRIPYNVNTALVPAALRAISALSAGGWFPEHPDWSQVAAEYAKVWEDNTLRLFEVTVPVDEAQRLVDSYTETSGYGFPSLSDQITSDVIFHGLALEGNNDQPLVRVMNSDDCFRLFLTNTTNQEQLTAFINQTANNIRRPFPTGLLTPVSLLVANPAYGGDPVYSANWTNNAYHGTVVWSWQLAMMASGLERQLARCTDGEAPDFCTDEMVYPNVVAAYNALWDSIDANAANLNSEVWSWIYQDDTFVFEPLGALPPPAGQNPTESNIRQLWSLAFIAVKRNESLRT